MGDRARAAPALESVGRRTGFSGWNDQCDVRVLASLGITAPRRIHSDIIPTALELSRGPLGGIITSASRLVIRRINSLATGFPGRMAGSPESPPASKDRLWSSLSPPCCLSGPWQEKQCLLRRFRAASLGSAASARRPVVAVAIISKSGKPLMGSILTPVAKKDRPATTARASRPGSR